MATSRLNEAPVSHAIPSSPGRSRWFPSSLNEAPGFPSNTVVTGAEPMAPTTPKRSLWFPRQYHCRRGGADGSHHAQTKPLVSQAIPLSPRRSRWFTSRPNEASGFPGNTVVTEVEPMVPTTPKRSLWFPGQYGCHRGGADGSHHAQTKPLVSQAIPLSPRRGRWLSPRPSEALGFLMAPSGEHVVRGGKHDSLVTRAECARAPIPDAPLP